MQIIAETHARHDIIQADDGTDYFGEITVLMKEINIAYIIN